MSNQHALHPPASEVLIAGGKPAERIALVRALSANDFRVAAVGGAGRAIEHAGRIATELVIADLRGGELELEALCAGLRAQDGGELIAVLALVAGAADLAPACERGAWDACVSSADATELVARVRGLLRRRDERIEFAALATAEALCRRVSGVGSWTAKTAGGFALSARAASILGLGSEERGLSLEEWLERIPAEERPRARAWFDGLAAGDGEHELEHSLVVLEATRDAPAAERLVRVQAARVPGLARVAGTLEDLSARRHEGVSGFYNRPQFLERLGAALESLDQRGGHLAVLCIELDRFRAIAGTLSPQAGDELLFAVGRRLRESLRDGDVLARLGCRLAGTSIARISGDEFTVLLEGIAQVEDAARIGRRLLEVLADPFAIEGREVYVASSIGVAGCPGDSRSAEELIRSAETAAYCAKQQGPNSLQFHTPAMNARAFERLTLESSLRRAVEREELVVYYQPRVEIQSENVVGVEALVRWRHPELGLVSPGQFIPLAEETGLIVPIGEWVLGEACAQNRRWQDAGLAPVRMSVNLSSAQFRQPDLFDAITRVLDASGLDPRWLELELTESLLMQNAASAVATLGRFKRAGIHLSIDDFGTGYSSLAYLKRFPIDALKIDQSFVREVTASPDDAAIATSIILMGKSLKLRVVAEGVETQSQLAFLRVMGCDEAQGFLFSPPVPAADAARFLRDGLRPGVAA